MTRIPQIVAVATTLALTCISSTSFAESRSKGDGRSGAAVVVSHQGGRAVVEGAAVARWVAKMPLWCFEATAEGPGLLLFTAEVVHVVGQSAAVQVTDAQAEIVREGAICEPRWIGEARAFHQPLAADKSATGDKPENKGPAQPVVRVRHRPPQAAPWGKPIWLEAVLEGPADHLSLFWRPGSVGPYAELALDAKGDGLFGGSLVVPQSEPAATQVQYYLVAAGTGGRTVVFANPAEPYSLQLDSAPAEEEEQLVVHGPIDRASQHQAVEVLAQINKRFSKPTLFYRSRGSGSFRSLPMLPMGPEQWRGVIAARDVVAPGFAYYISVFDEKGIARPGFASARSPQTVTVLQPQILSEDENRNRVGIRYAYTDHGGSGTPADAYQAGELSLERLFFGFLIARLSAAGWWGHAQRTSIVQDVDGKSSKSVTEMAPMKFFLGRAGLDFHLGDYVALSTDFDMASYRGGSGAGYRAVAHIGDEHVASIELGIEQLWDVDSADRVYDVRRGTLLVPMTDGWRLSATASQERILTDAPKAIRLMVGVEVDLGSHVQLDAGGGAAGRRDNLGPSGTGGAKIKF